MALQTSPDYKTALRGMFFTLGTKIPWLIVGTILGVITFPGSFTFSTTSNYFIGRAELFVGNDISKAIFLRPFTWVPRHQTSSIHAWFKLCQLWILSTIAGVSLPMAMLAGLCLHQDQRVYLDHLPTHYQIWLALTGSFLAGLTEERTMRGTLLTFLLSKYNITFSLIFDSVIFAALHFTIPSTLRELDVLTIHLPIALLMGLVYGVWYLQFRSLSACILFHSAYDFATALLFGDSDYGYSGLSSGVGPTYAWHWISSVYMPIIILLLALLFKSRHLAKSQEAPMLV